MVVDKLINNLTANNISKKSFEGELYKYKDILLLKPTTFMNLSGKSVQSVANFYKINLDDILVVHDEIDIPFGAIRLKKGGGSGGHNGLKSIDSLVGKEYNRLRLGVGKPEHKSMVASYVLSDFSNKEQEVLDKFVNLGALIAKEWINMPLDELKSIYSKKDSSYLYE
jgi:PTH1 family peptidyl-tRNA hydrolase